MISFERIDYIPSSEPLKMAFRGELKTETNTPPTKIQFMHRPNADELNLTPTATIKIWAARNKGGVTAHIDGGSAVSPFKQRDYFITSYIPGLAGLSERETILAQPLLRRQAASGDAGGVLRNVLLNLSSKLPNEADDSNAKLRMGNLNRLISEVHEGLKIHVSFNEREDFNINAGYRSPSLGNEVRSLETAATGVLQVIQIFAYMILFKPKIMLIDEPDAHLHPDKQERLIETLEKAAEEFDIQIILTTHSPHVIRSASAAVKFIWMKDGKVKADEERTIRRLMGWGALDKKALFFIEDEIDAPIQSILNQWPELNRQISICRCYGIENLPKRRLLSGMMIDGNLMIKALIHRDRDFLNDDEVLVWKQQYETTDVVTWITKHNDIEGYFCEPEYLSALYEVDLDTANQWVTNASLECNRLTPAPYKTFYEKRKKINQDFHRDGGGSPATDVLWNALNHPSPKSILGKFLFKAIKKEVHQARLDSKRLDKWEIAKGHQLAADLRIALEALLK